MQRFLSHWFQTPQVSDQSLEISSDMPEKAYNPRRREGDFNHHFSLRRDSRTTVAQRDRLPLRRFRRRRN